MQFRIWLEAEAREFGAGTVPWEIEPMEKGDKFRVYHGFYNFTDAVNVALHGLSGGMRIGRVYSYESENNPRGLFVTLNLDKAQKDFAGGQKGVVMEFVADERELEPPVWPSGSYTVQGQMAPYFYEDPRGARIARQDAKRRAEEEAKKSQYDVYSQSHRPGLAWTLFSGREMQALFVGNLNPERIERFWIQVPEPEKTYRSILSDWKPMTREEFLAEFGQDFKAQGVADEYAQYRLLQPEDEFDTDKVIKSFNQEYNKDVDSEKKLYDEFIGSLVHGPVMGTFKDRSKLVSRFGQYIWPKQMPGLVKWVRKMFKKHGEPE